MVMRDLVLLSTHYFDCTVDCFTLYNKYYTDFYVKFWSTLGLIIVKGKKVLNF